MSIIVLLVMPGCTGESPKPPGKPKVAATIFPLYDIIRNIAGDKIQVELVLPPGASPHLFDLTPQKVEELQGTDIVFRIGHGLDDWTANLSAFLPGAQTVVVDEGINLIFSSEADHEEAGGGGGSANPHYWLAVENAEIIAHTITNRLITLDPANEDTYRGNLKTYVDKLEQLKTQIQKELKPLSGAELVTFHDSFSYFAREFDLTIAATIEPYPGKEPTPRYLADLQKTVEQYDIKVLFTEPQLSSASVQAFVEDLSLRLYVLDPLGGVAGRDSYISLMHYNANTIAEALL